LRKLAVLVVLVVAGAVTLVPAAPAFAASSISLTVNSIDRPTSSGMLEYDVTVSAAGFLSSTDVCQTTGFSTGCSVGLHGRQASNGNWVGLASTSVLSGPDPVSVSFTGSIERSLTAIRATLYGPNGDIYSSSYTVTHWMPVPAVDLIVNELSRNETTGELNYDFDVVGEYYQLDAGVCTSSYPGTCNGGVQVKYAGSNVANSFVSANGFLNQSYPYTKNFASSRTAQTITHVRAFIDGANGTLYGDWVAVDDIAPVSGIFMTVDSFGRDSSTGDLIYDVDISEPFTGYYFPDTVCPSAPGSSCTTILQGRLADGTDRGIAYHSDEPYGYSNSVELAGSVYTVSPLPYVAIRAMLEGRDGTIFSDWVAVTDPLANEYLGGSNLAEKYCVCAHGDPVNSANGEFYLPASDLALPGVGPAIEIARTYSSKGAAEDGPFGRGWAASFTTGMEVVTPGDVSDPLPRVVNVVQENGSVVQFTEQTDHTYEAAERVFATLEYDSGASRWTFVRQSTEIMVFDHDGVLIELQDLNGNTVELGYTSGKVTSLTASGGRSIELTWASGRVVALEDSSGREVEYDYDGSGNLVSVTAADGAETEYGYDSAHRMTSLTKPGGGVTTNVYDGYGRIVSQTDPLSRETTFSYSGLSTTITGWDGAQTVDRYSEGRLVSQTTAAATALEATTTFVYDNAGNTLSSVDPLGNITAHTYDDRGNVLTTTDALENTTTLTYNAFNEVTSVVDPLERETTSTYDGEGNLTSTTSPSGRVTEFTPNADGTVASIEDSRGMITILTYDGAGRLLSTTDPNARTSSVTYTSAGFTATTTDAGGNATSYTTDGLGRVLTRTDPLAHVTTYTYDLDGNLLSTEDANSHVISSVYDLAGQVTSTTDARGKVTTYTYSDGGYLESVTDPDGRTTTNTYDLLGRLTAAADGNANTTRYEYDLAGRLLNQTRPSLSESSFTYDDLGQRLTSTDGNGKTTTYAYDAAGQLVSVTDPLSRVTGTSYTDDGQVETVTYPDASTREYEYNLTGQITTFTDQDGNVTTYAYDDGWLLTAKTAPGSVTTAYTYDDAGRLGTTTLPDATTITNSYDDTSNLTLQEFSAPGATDTEFTYDPVGLRTSMTDASSTSSYIYNANGQLLSETNGASQTLTYSYTDAGLLDSIVYPGSHTVDYEYDDAGRMESVTDWNSNTTTFEWTADGQLSTQTDPNGVLQTRTYDGAGQTTAITTADALATIATYGYDYDDAGQLVSDTTTDPILSALTHAYTYDALRQVTSKDDGTTSLGYTPSPAGQLTALEGNALAYDSAQRLVSYTPPSGPATTFDYDDNGSRTGKTVAASAPDPAQSTTYAYDPVGNLVSVTLPGDPTPTVEYTSNGDGLRQSRTENATTSSFLWSSASALPLLMSDGDATYIYGPSSTPISQVDYLDHVDYLFGDLLGSVRLITDDVGAVTGTTEYGTYGEPTDASGAATSPFGYSGNWTDSTTGLVNLRAREYDPTVGQFLTIDPVVDRTREPYAYAGNNPIQNVDHTGERYCPASGGPCFEDPVPTAEQIASRYREQVQQMCNEQMWAAAIDRNLTLSGYPQWLEGFLRGYMYWAPAIKATGALAVGLQGGVFEGRVGGTAPRPALSDVLPTPQVSSPKLQNIINNLYSGTTNPTRVGTGTTADAIRSELITGEPTGGKFHTIKGNESINGLNNWLARNPDASYADRLVAQSLLDDLRNALGEP